MTDTTIVTEIAELRRAAEVEPDIGWIKVDPAFVIQLCDLASRALPAAPAAGDEKPQSFAVMTASGQTVPVEAYTAKQVARIRKQARREAIAECIAALKKEREAFLSEEYAYPQPIGSLSERFACDECIKAIEALAEAKS